jgi:hypothetical protein
MSKAEMLNAACIVCLIERLQCSLEAVLAVFIQKKRSKLFQNLMPAAASMC